MNGLLRTDERAKRPHHRLQAACLKWEQAEIGK
jgi:hypothetical protein